MVTLPGPLTLPRYGLSVARRAAHITGRILTATDGRDILHNSPDGWEVSQPWLWWMGPGDGSQGPFGHPPPGAGEPVYGLTAIPGVTRCTSIICDTIAGLPWHVMRGEERLPTPRWIYDPQLLRPDSRAASGLLSPVRLSAVEFWTQYLTAALWVGDAFIFAPERDAQGQPVPPLWQLHPSKVTVEDDQYYVTGSDQPLPADSIIHLRGEPPYFQGRGHGVLTRHGAALGLSLTVGNYAAGQYSSGVPAGVLKSTQPNLTEPEAQNLKTQWMAAHGSGRRSIAVLNATTEFTPLMFSPVDAALDAANTWNLKQLALAFGVPPYMLGVPGDSGTYANVESRMIELRQFSLLQWVRRAESTLDAQFPLGTSLKIKTAGLERADTKARYEAYKLGIDGGWLTVDDVRALEDMPPIAEDAAAINDLQPDDQQQQLPVMPQVPQLPAAQDAQGVPQ